ncbi:MAG: hypothetical protein ACF8OB_07365, partial [Phycisphaeraceae bacterium JB051]
LVEHFTDGALGNAAVLGNLGNGDAGHADPARKTLRKPVSLSEYRRRSGAVKHLDVFFCGVAGTWSRALKTFLATDAHR